MYLLLLVSLTCFTFWRNDFRLFELDSTRSCLFDWFYSFDSEFFFGRVVLRTIWHPWQRVAEAPKKALFGFAFSSPQGARVERSYSEGGAKLRWSCFDRGRPSQIAYCDLLLRFFDKGFLGAILSSALCLLMPVEWIEWVESRTSEMAGHRFYLVGIEAKAHLRAGGKAGCWASNESNGLCAAIWVVFFGKCLICEKICVTLHFEMARTMSVLLIDFQLWKKNVRDLQLSHW